MKPFYITTSIAYPNANPHIGYALELVQADFLARYNRLQGRETYYLTGLDVHGLKIQRTAETEGKSPAEFVAEKKQVYERLAKELSLSNDRFILTNDPDHEAMSQALWRMCEAQGDIYKKRYQAWYNIKEEEFLGLVDENPDPSVFGIDSRFIEKIDEENYFFRLSRYQEEVMKVLENGQYKVTPGGRLQELLNFVKEKGLQDVSISREREKLAWGVPVPGDESQVMYVWYDALTNYLTPVSTVDTLGKIIPGTLWPASLHCIGKDISRFHALLWTGMLLSAGIQLPEEVLVHGFITSEGQKMSKSIGNVVDPFAVIEEFGTDAVRWFLLKEIPTTGDGDYTADRMRRSYTADLANDFGNLVSRVWTMCQKYTDGKVPVYSGRPSTMTEKAWNDYHQYVDTREINLALATAHSLLVSCNKNIDEAKPWVLAKDSGKKNELDNLLYELLETIRQTTAMLLPVLPNTAQRIAEQVFPNVSAEAWVSQNVASKWGILESGTELGTEPVILFPRKEA